MHEFLEPINTLFLNNNKRYDDEQYGGHISAYEDEFPDLSEIDIVIIGINEYRGEGMNDGSAAEAIRRQLYQLYSWHGDITIADIGNVRKGAAIADSYAAIKTVLIELWKMNKIVILPSATAKPRR